jgi:hypothetical protein
VPGSCVVAVVGWWHHLHGSLCLRVLMCCVIYRFYSISVRLCASPPFMPAMRDMLATMHLSHHPYSLQTCSSVWSSYMGPSCTCSMAVCVLAARCIVAAHITTPPPPAWGSWQLLRLLQTLWSCGVLCVACEWCRVLLVNTNRLALPPSRSRYSPGVPATLHLYSPTTCGDA